MHVVKGMTVRVIRGNHRGEEGKVLVVFLKDQRVIVEGVNFIKRHTKPTQDNPQGGIIEKEAPIHVSNVMVVHGGQPTRVGFKRLEDGTKVKIAKKTGAEIGL